MIKNAFAYVTRKSLKSLIIMLVILAMSTLSLISLSIKDATDRASKETFANILDSRKRDEDTTSRIAANP